MLLLNLGFNLHKSHRMQIFKKKAQGCFLKLENLRIASGFYSKTGARIKKKMKMLMINKSL